MTKKVRIENADTSSYKVVVIVQDKVHDENSLWTGEWREVERFHLDHPSAMKETYITSTRRLVVEES